VKVTRPLEATLNVTPDALCADTLPPLLCQPVTEAVPLLVTVKRITVPKLVSVPPLFPRPVV
jgi:hypothetical protein